MIFSELTFFVFLNHEFIEFILFLFHLKFIDCRSGENISLRSIYNPTLLKFLIHLLFYSSLLVVRYLHSLIIICFYLILQYTFYQSSLIIEVFEHALANTAGEDLAKILWLKSETSETWLQRRYRACYAMICYAITCHVLYFHFYLSIL